MKVRYDRDEDILMVEVTEEGVIDHAEHAGSFIAHFSSKGELILLEILDASELLVSLMKATIQGKEQELPLRTKIPP